MDKELERVRAEAAGIELDEELAARFPVKSRQKLEIPGDEADITVYLYEPENRTGVTPLIINLHGGGFVKSYRGRDIILSQNFAWHTGCLVADVDYKTAPEKKYPYAQMEGYRVVEYFYQHAEQYRIDPQRIILSGQSAGANLIIGIAMRFLRREEHPVCQLIMAYPPLDLYKDPMEKPFTESEEEKKMAINGRLYHDWYIDEELRRESYASPVYASEEELRGLPPVLLLTGGLDSLGEEAERFTYQLIRAGVPVTAKRFLTAKHGFLARRNSEFVEAEKMIFDVIKQIKDGEELVNP